MEIHTADLKQNTKKRVLIAALDWGLGHATRCMSLINTLIELGHIPVLASSGNALLFWQKNYPKLEFVPLSPLQVSYDGPAWWSALLQSPHMLRHFLADDKRLLHDYLKQRPVDFIVSDNRYGCWFPGIPSVLLSNQLDLLPPSGWQGLPAFVWKNTWRMAFRRFVAPFQELWVPEFEASTQQLAKDMLQNPTKIPIRYIGLMSRLPALHSDVQKKGTLLLLSGPEPQRTAFERLLLEQKAHLPQPITLVRGNPKAKTLESSPDLQIIDAVFDPEKLAALIHQHQYIICRSGHSTLSDLYYTGAHFAVVSTPGQPEQQYLAKRLSQMGIAPHQEQKSLDVASLIADIDKFTGFKGQKAESLTNLWQQVLNSL